MEPQKYATKIFKPNNAQKTQKTGEFDPEEGVMKLPIPG